MTIEIKHSEYLAPWRVVFYAALIIFICSGFAPLRAGRFDINVEVQAGYDDNVLDYSDADLDLFTDPSEPQNKYGIISKDDYIIVPAVDIAYKTFLAGHSLHLGVINSYAYYKENDVKRYYRLEGYFRRYFARGVYFQGNVTYLPDYYYRNSYSLLNAYEEAKFDKLIFEGKLSMQLTNKIQANAFYGYSNKDFIPHFDDRDINQHEITGQFVYRPNHLWKGWVSYGFIRAVGAGKDNSNYPRDTSFDMNSFVAGSRLYLHGINRRSWQLAGYVAFDQVFFQTDKITEQDKYRLGRQDHRWYIALMTEHSVNRNMGVGFEYRRMVKNVDLPASAAYLIPSLEANSNSYFFVVNYHL